LLVAVAVAVAIFFNHRAGPDSWPYGWTAIFVSLGMLFLGFGAGMLFYQRRQRALSADLRNDFANLSARTRALSAEMDDLIKRKHASGS
jgi:hypothetical protein